MDVCVGAHPNHWRSCWRILVMYNFQKPWLNLRTIGLGWRWEKVTDPHQTTLQSVRRDSFNRLASNRLAVGTLQPVNLLVYVMTYSVTCRCCSHQCAKIAHFSHFQDVLWWSSSEWPRSSLVRDQIQVFWPGGICQMLEGKTKKNPRWPFGFSLICILC